MSDKKEQVFTKQIGKMKYIVNVHFKEDGKDNLNDKIKRMLKNDILNDDKNEYSVTED